MHKKGNTNTETIFVIKRNGNKEPLDIEKIHKVVIEACKGIPNVSPSEIEIRSQLQFYPNIKTSDIQETLIKAAGDLISEETPNYQWVAGRLINYHLRKQVYGDFTPWKLIDIVKKNVSLGFYEPKLLEWYSEKEWEQMEKFIKHSRDEQLTYAAMGQFRGKYLVQNRTTGQILETPQVCYMLIAATLFHKYPNTHEEAIARNMPGLPNNMTRLEWVKEYYDAISEHYISLPTPIMAGVRTPQRQFSSCVLIESGDSIDSIAAAGSAIMKYVSKRAGIGIGAGRIRAVGSPVRNGDTSHTGVIPFYKFFQAATKSCSQGGVRGGAATLCTVIWHLEIEDILVLKNNKGIDDTRVRHIDYCIQISKLFYERLIKNQNITLFSPSDVPGLYDAFFRNQEEFKKLYEAAEANPNIRKKTIKAIDLFSQLMQERKETGRIYIMNVDHCNTHSSFLEDKAPIKMTNLCIFGDDTVRIKYEDTETTIPIKDLGYYCMTNNDVYVLSNNGINPVWARVSKFAKTHPAAKTIKITDAATGRSLRCTEDHKIFTKNRGYVEAKNLRGDDILNIFAAEEGVSSNIIIEHMDDLVEVYDITVEGTHCFYVNDILVHNCVEITLPTAPLEHLFDENGRIALCTLSAINWGKINSPNDFAKPAMLAVRALDELLDYQDFPVTAAKLHSLEYRPLGIGIINFAYWAAKNDIRYDGVTKEQLEKIDQYAEAWSYYLIKASCDLAKEKGTPLLIDNTKYKQGIVPHDTRKLDVDELVPMVERMPWQALREDLKTYGIRNATLMALMPAETSAQIANATNGMEPPRAFVSVKQSKDGIFKQVVPDFKKLKNKYDLLWDQKSPEGYLKIMAVFQKWIDQSISVNTSYNPLHYPEEKIPMSELLKHLLMCYKYGLKTLYYFNQYDGQGEIELDTSQKQIGLSETNRTNNNNNDNSCDDTCDVCVI